MFQFFSEIGFNIVKPAILAYMKKKNYPQDAVVRKNARFVEGFSKDDNVIMFHAVSVGEAVALENLVRRTRKEFPEAKIVVTTGTWTGQDIAKKKIGEVVDLVTYFPFDCPSIVKRFLDKINPTTVFIAETEIWPNFAKECNKRGVNLYVINGRISDSTFKSYDMFRFVFKPFLNLYTGIFTQSEDDNNKFLKLGANPETTKVMNNLKFDIKKPEINFEFDKGKSKVLLAGSTHQGEDEIILNVFKELKSKDADLKMILAPRHLTRVDEVVSLIEKIGFKYDLRSNDRKDLEGIDILVLNTLGELGKMYNFADVAFIGGSFNKTGGHNPLEALVFGKPVVSGPSTHNFKDIYNIIKKANAGFVVGSENEFLNIADKLFFEEDFYNLTSQNCEKVFNEQQGALEFVINVLKTL